ncbi:MAG TPA: hypothetical protein VJ867_04615, partial [Gemmatimonadaceae bacterium]|nr:hypothetical protein [Gemmatimonadaceae bacterium]
MTSPPATRCASANHLEHSEDAVEQEQESQGVSRGQNQLHLTHEDWQAAADAVRTLLERIDAGTAVAQVVVVTADAESAAGIAERLAASARPDVRILAATSTRRAMRVQRTNPAHVVLGDAVTLLALIESTALKRDDLKAVVLAWIEDAGPADTQALETVMAEMPKDSARVVFASAVSPAVESIVERYARRARRVAPPASDAPPASLSFVAVSETGRMNALRRVLDAMDPASTVVLVRDPAIRDDVHAALRGLGYTSETDAVRVVSEP